MQVKRILVFMVVATLVISLSGCSLLGKLSKRSSDETTSAGSEKVETKAENKAETTPDKVETIVLNEEIITFMGMPNSRLKEILGKDCYCEIMYGGAATVDYYEQPLEYPLMFWLEGDQDRMESAWGEAYDAQGEFPTGNIFPDDFTVSVVFLYGQDEIESLFLSDETLTYDSISAFFGQQPKMEFLSKDAEMDRSYEVDLYLADYLLDDYSFHIGYEKTGEVYTPYFVEIWFAGAYN